MARSIYLDNAATTPPDKCVIAAMCKHLHATWGNPSSGHKEGREAKAGVEKARASMAKLIGCLPEEIFWTSGATESNNLALRGIADARGGHIITCATEHKAILATCKCLAREGIEVDILEVDKYGQIDPDELWDLIRDDTSLVSIMAANNETGVLHDLATIGGICADKKTALHVDAAQAIGKVPLQVDDYSIDFLSISAHKFHGPKGIGALYVRHGKYADLEPQISGGGQECNMRSGTLNVPAIAGAGEAAKLATNHVRDAKHAHKLRARLLHRLRGSLGDVPVTAEAAPRLPGTLHVAFPGAASRTLLRRLDGKVAVSSGSACSAGCSKPSYVIKAMGYPDTYATSSLRISVGRQNTTAEIDRAAAHIIRAIRG